MSGIGDFAGARLALTPVIADDGSTVYQIQVVSSGGSGASSNQVQGTAANGAAPVGNPILAAGSDGTSQRTLRTTANGALLSTPVSSAGALLSDGNAIVTQPALSASFWAYAAATGGIVNSNTAVLVKAAAGAGIRNYLESISLDWDSLTTSTEIAIRDGAGGAVLWRGFIKSGTPGNRVIAFRPALKGTANTLMEFVTLTAAGAGAGVYLNAQGWTGA